MRFESEINKIEQKEKFNPQFEIGGYDDVESSIIYSAVSKIIEDRWGNEQNEEIVIEIKNQNIQIDEYLRDLYQRVRKLADNNAETLRWLAFIVDKDEKSQSYVIEQLIQHKGLNEKDAKGLFLAFNEFYQKVKNVLGIEKLKLFIGFDIDKRKEQFPKLKEMIGDAIEFFNPQASKIKRVVYLPTNPLAKKQSGWGLKVGETFYVNAEHGNEVNEIHEFLHGIINPITEKIELSREDENVILNLCPEKLKGYQYPLSILTEEIIRTYRTGFRSENKPSVENFKKRLLVAKRADLKKMLEQEKQQGVAMANNVDELLSNDEIIEKYYVKYSQDVLSERIWKFFEVYQGSGVDNFEDYFLKNYRQIFM